RRRHDSLRLCGGGRRTPQTGSAPERRGLDAIVREIDEQAAMPSDPTQDKPHRPIRSYVLRQGRLSPAQRRACDDLFPLYGVPFSTEAVDWAGIFGRRAPVVLETGFGMGETTAVIADAHRDLDCVAVGVH